LDFLQYDERIYNLLLFRYFGIDLQSQESYDLASRGLLRPMDNKSPPIIYSIRCLEYRAPYFKLGKWNGCSSIVHPEHTRLPPIIPKEIHIINETCLFLRELVHDIGYRLKTNAICTKTRRIRDGFVDVALSLPITKWTFDSIYGNNIKLNKLAYDNLKTLNKTVLIGQSKQNEMSLLNKMNSEYIVDLDTNI
jgi:hypothetical protein